MPPIASGKTIIYKSNCNLNPVATLLDLPLVGAENTLYIVKDTAAIYIWDGADYIVYDSRPYKVYTALLTQTGTDTPVATVLENTLGGTVVWIRDGVGSYSCVLSGAFLANKTWTSALYGGSAIAPKVGVKLYRFDNNFVVLKVFNELEVALELQSEYPISVEIRVYS